jgi:hypothetical protein
MASTSRVAGSRRSRSQHPQSSEPLRTTPVSKPRQKAVVGRLAAPPVERIGPSMPIAPMKIMETSRGTLLDR